MRADSRCTMFLCANEQWGAYKHAYLSLYSFLSSEAIESRGGGRDQRVKKVSRKTRCGGDVLGTLILWGQKLDQLYFQTYSLNARFAGILRFQSNVRISVDCFRFQIRSEFFDSEPKKFNFDVIEE